MKYAFLRRILVPALCGTTAMTLYSYGVSLVKDKNYKEPVLLGKMAGRLLLMPDNKMEKWSGWSMHYGMGVLFAELYAPYWKAGDPTRNNKTGLILGGISGIAAILIWKFTLAAHPLPPAVDFTGFAAVLFVAHLVFGVFAALGFSAVEPHPLQE